MADKKEDKDPTARAERVIDEHIVTQGDKVFFPGTALVDERTDAQIDAAIEEKERIAAAQSSVEMEEEDTGGELGDSRTSRAKKAAKKGK